ncbi:uncharacterized protein PHACADRAFT_259326, partial [Phanerochaete carnosa HHB-10118-sp]
MSSSDDSTALTCDQRKVSFASPSMSLIQPRSVDASKLKKPRAKPRPMVKRGSLEAKLGASAYLAGLLNKEMERGNAQRMQDSLEPLVELTIPKDFVYTPRIYAIELDNEVEEVLMQWTRQVCRIPDEDKPRKGIVLSCALAALRDVTGISRLKFEFALRERPIPEGQHDSFPILAIFYAYEYGTMHWRPTQKQVGKLSEILSGRQPKWYIDKYPFDS